jgi:hypothetical protein
LGACTQHFTSLLLPMRLLLLHPLLPLLRLLLLLSLLLLPLCGQCCIHVVAQQGAAQCRHLRPYLVGAARHQL